MPYIPSKKTDGKSKDREILDVAVKQLAEYAAEKIKNNLSLISVYENLFSKLAKNLVNLLKGKKVAKKDPVAVLAEKIYKIGLGYGYDGAYLGELNYSITRFIQVVPQIKVKKGEWKEEFRYWFYAATIESLIFIAHKTEKLSLGISGVFEDVKDEYKRRVNVAYEAEQIIKSGDAYDAPYYTKLVEVADENGKIIGHIEIMLKKNAETLRLDILGAQIILRKKK